MIRLPNGAYANPEHVSAIREHASDSKTTVIAFISGDTIELPLITTNEAHALLFPERSPGPCADGRATLLGAEAQIKRVRLEALDDVISKLEDAESAGKVSDRYSAVVGLEMAMAIVERMKD